jgi:hypothetical protein
MFRSLIRRTQGIGKKSYLPTRVATVKFFNFNKILLVSFCEENCTVKLWGIQKCSLIIRTVRLTLVRG